MGCAGNISMSSQPGVSIVSLTRRPVRLLRVLRFRGFHARPMAALGEFTLATVVWRAPRRRSFSVTHAGRVLEVCVLYAVRRLLEMNDGFYIVVNLVS